MLEKEMLRKEAKQRLAQITELDRASIEKNMLHHLLHSEIWNKANRIAITISQPYEWSTKEIIRAAWEQGKKVCIPKCYPVKKEMIFYDFSSFKELESVYFNLYEPIPNTDLKQDKNDIDLIIVPGILFDLEGYRIGHGGGYYDRYLKGYHGDTLSLASTFQVIKEIPREHFDIAVQVIVTEEGFL
ncbi:5-formyltetrahydrofolate cyclo-ligase [Aquibacillus koreensis]|uniref:5-formyltetrahydrofolate cyclo-ligase n=1 Tax=Aquibacillus koreensis TaxID=279446 RepID=A0A9X3WHC9_9BACI|nr:5-formyltetrahydrofolate cyclo-ligase [Aquibacillus koreensis]MCT2537562.1 5-formyltetrahydrofolate cyclo-ligase [Aquibacillus koreensis]MDC3419008.1 5-formyltetrahydrofolate cyclo-ligase [Aquibacillus koreensis]